MLNHGWIDCHTHIFPEPKNFIDRLSPSAREFGRTRILPQLLRFADEIRQKIPLTFPTLPLDVESVAVFRQSMSKPWLAAGEMLASFSLMPQVLLRSGPGFLQESMQRAGISKSIVIAAPPLASNDWLLSQDFDNLVPVVTLPKLRKDATLSAWRARLLQLATKGAKGFKIHPNMDGLPATHVAYRAIFEVAQKHRLFVILHTGCFFVPSYKHREPADPRAFEKYFKAFSSVPVCLAHMNRDEPEVVWRLMAKYEQLYTDTSWQGAETIQKAIATIGSDRILLGSDWPLLHENLQSEAISILQRATNDSQFEAIAKTNAQRFLSSLNVIPALSRNLEQTVALGATA